MHGWSLIFVLGGAGGLLLLLEIFLPGLIAGLFGLGLCLASVVIAFTRLGPDAGWLTLLTELVIYGSAFFLWLRLFPKTPLGRRMILSETNTDAPKQTWPVGTEGVTLSPLRPVGVAEFAGQRCDVVAENSFIPVGSSIKIVRAEKFRIVVRLL